MFTWSEDGIRWYEDAAAWTGYHARIAEKLSGYLSRNDEICDVGCGTGSLSVELSSAVKKIMSVDVDDRALDCLRSKIAKQGILNIEVLRMDYTRLPENFCDVVVACSFGVFEKNGASFLKLAKNRLIMVKRKFIESQEGFSKDYGRGNMAYMDEKYLQANHIPYRIESYADDFGQPLRSRAEAEHFVEHYWLHRSEESVADFLDRRMILTGDGTFPYYLPNPMENCFLIIEKADFPCKT